MAEMEDRRKRVVERDLQRFLSALETDLETMPPEVVCSRVARFFSVDLREVLAPASWSDLPMHVGHRCRGCDYLGYRWTKAGASTQEQQEQERERADYCWQTAERLGHLSRVRGLSEGACGKLLEGQIRSILDLSSVTAGNKVFEQHQALRASRTVLRQRAVSLRDASPAEIPDKAGTAALLPRYSDIQVAVSADYDVGSGLTFAFGYEILCFDEVPDDSGQPKFVARRMKRPMLVEQRKVEEEGDIFCQWLGHLVRDIMAADAAIRPIRRRRYPNRPDPTIQFYFWDRLTFDHLSRVMGRHLLRVQTEEMRTRTDISFTSWLFPAEQTLEDPGYIGRESPVTVVSDVINSLIAAPIPHHYSLIEVANSYRVPRRDGAKPYEYRVSPFYMDPLSDQIPPERGHEIWSKRTPYKDGDYQTHRVEVRSVVEEKLSAILSVVRRLVQDLADTLTAEAPRVADVMRPVHRLMGVPLDGQVLLQHTKLLAAAERLEVDLLIAMPPHEREARFQSMRLVAHLSGADRAAALDATDLSGLRGTARALAFRVSDRSRDVKMKEGEFLLSLMPEADQSLMSDWSVMKFKTEFPAVEMRCPSQQRDWHSRLRDELRVEIKGFDRARLLVVLMASDLLAAAIDAGVFDIEFDLRAGKFGIVDPVVIDFFTGQKLVPALEAIKAPPIALSRPLFTDPALIRVARGTPRRSAAVPAGDFIWNADVVAQERSGRSKADVAARLDSMFPHLTEKQREAVLEAATRRLTLWWGPPGTGKSATAVALLTTLVSEAHAGGRRLRIAVTGQTWVAIDNVLRKLPQEFDARDIRGARIARLTSGEGFDAVDPRLRPHAVSTKSDAAFPALCDRMQADDAIVVVGSTADQLFKICGRDLASCFDILLIDEASQMDVAHSVVCFTKLAPDASVVVVGDDLQMPPIHKVEPPKGVEHLLGSIYDFYVRYRGAAPEANTIPRVMLDRSFRSNREIIEFVREAGYGDQLEAAYPDLRIGFEKAPSSDRPSDWPDDLEWSDKYDFILQPEEPLVAVINSDIYSSQRNQEEADLVVSLVRRLYDRGLLDIEDRNERPYSPSAFFERGVGICTPHRAQQAAVLDGLFRHLPLQEVDQETMYNSVDTVERFQGQEKAVMIASFGLGDADQIGAEEEFLYSLNRFNVIASRAKAKLIVLVSRRLVDHLPRERKVLEQSRLLKHYADGFLRRAEAVSLPGFPTACEIKFR
jgi:hypothetical protein